MLPYQPAPIAIFAYKRTIHLVRTLDSLEECPEFSSSPVFVFSDGPKNAAAESLVADVRKMLASRLRPNMTIIPSATNLGLARSIVKGVSQLCDQFGKVIVVEDDLLVSPCFLTWLNRGLEFYRDDPNVWQVSGHQYPVPQFEKRSQGMLLHLVTSWGWATWKRAWEQYDPDAVGWEALTTDRALRNRFDLSGAYPYSRLLTQQMSGAADSWAIRWGWSSFRAGALTLFPPRSLVQNIGFDETATHSSFGRLKSVFVRSQEVAREIHCPELPADSVSNVSDEQRVFQAIRNMWWSTRIRARLMDFLRR